MAAKIILLVLSLNVYQVRQIGCPWAHFLKAHLPNRTMAALNSGDTDTSTDSIPKSFKLPRFPSVVALLNS